MGYRYPSRTPRHGGDLFVENIQVSRMQKGRLFDGLLSSLKMKFKYNLPRGYLSYSAIMLWIKNPDAYRRRYYLNEKDIESEPMRFGKKIAEVLQSRDFKEFPALRQVPYYPISEHPLDVEVDGIRVKAYLDLWKQEGFSFGEVKTGSVSHTNGPPWDKVKVARHEQLPFYSFLIKKTYGKVDPIVPLIWLETRYKSVTDRVGSRLMEGEGKELELTGRIEIFKRRIAEWERVRIRKLIIKTAKEISKDYTKFQNETNNTARASKEGLLIGRPSNLQEEGVGLFPRTTKKGSGRSKS